MKKTLVSLLTASVMMCSVGAVTASAAVPVAPTAGLLIAGDTSATDNVLKDVKRSAPVYRHYRGRYYLNVRWNRVARANGYRVYYKPAGYKTWSYKTVNAPCVKISGLKRGKQYNVRVRSFRKYKNKLYWSECKCVSCY